ncbi:MAG: flagellin [Succinivibrionaceae bacterium]
MALYVNTNVSSLNAQRQLNNSTRLLDTSYQRLASGLRINSAKDDAAGLQISDRMTSQINGLNQGNRNAQDGISFSQTAEGAMDEITNMLQRIRTLAIQSANGTNSESDRKAIQEEVAQLSAEVDRIACDTTYAGEKILDGTKGAADGLGRKMTTFQVGADANQTISIALGNEVKSYKTTETANVAIDYTKSTCIVKDNVNTVKKTDAFEADGTLKTDIMLHTDGNYYSKNDVVVVEARDADGNILVNAKNGKDSHLVKLEKAQINNIETKGWTIKDMAESLGLGSTAANLGNNKGFISNTSLSKATDAISFDVSTADNAQAALGVIDSFIGTIDSKRAELGAVQNRLESTIRNQSNISQNLSDARSQIRDTDFATETANMTQTNIIQQASQSILSQANQRPQMAIQLLQG